MGGSSGPAASGSEVLLDVACAMGGSTVDDDEPRRSGTTLPRGGSDSVSSMLTLEFRRDEVCEVTSGDPAGFSISNVSSSTLSPSLSLPP